MEESLQKQIQARFDELPADVQRAIRSSKMNEKVQELGKKHALHLDQIGELENETYLVMLGFTDPAEFAENLAKELNIPADKAEALAQDVSTALFVPIRQSMQQFAEEQAVHAAILEEANTKTTPAPAPAATTPPPMPAVQPKAPTPPAAVPPPPIAPIKTPPPPAPAAPKTPEVHPADLMLSQKQVTVAPTAPKTPAAGAPAAPATPPNAQKSAPAPASQSPQPPAPKPYTADPYREPI